MMRLRFRRALVFLTVFAGLAACLFLDTLPVRLSRLFGPIAAEILATFRDPGTQWMVYACCAVYFVTFTILGRRGTATSTPHPQSLPPLSRDTPHPASSHLLPNAEKGIEAERKVLQSAERGETFHLQPSTFNLFLSPDFWLCGLVVWVTLRYAFDYETASRNTHALALMAGAAIAQGVAIWMGWSHRRNRHLTPTLPPVEAERERKHQPSNAEHRISNKERAAAGTGEHSTLNIQPSTLNVGVVVVGCLILLLALAALWQPEGGTIFQYRGQSRWQGPWDNPNIYGLLMGVGFVLALGMVGQILRIADRRFWNGAQASCLSRVVSNCRRNGCSALLRVLWTLILIAAAGLCGFGLLRSYSRGAWIGTTLALAYLLWRRVGCGTPSASSDDRPAKSRGSAVTRNEFVHGSRCSSWFIKNGFSLFLLSISLFVVAFWQFRHTEQPLVRRVFTVGNPNDFSWRNRVAAWEGALAIMAEYPVAGVGWSRPEAMYDHYYRPVKVDEGMAIQLNHYFMVGMAAGVPALLFFLGYLGTVLLRTGDSGFRMCCGAAVMVLLVGLWFDGGLFNLATAAPLWLLLGLGNVAQTSGLWTSPSSSLTTEGDTDRRSVPRAARRSFLVVTVVCGLVTLLTALLWAHARDPFRRVTLRLNPDGAPATEARVVMPKDRGPFSVVLWLHGSGGGLLQDGDQLRQIAEMGLAAVAFDYDKTNQVNFDAQMSLLLSHIVRQRWAQKDSMGWIANSLGAVRTLAFLVNHPDLAPKVMVQLNGGGIQVNAELEAPDSRFSFEHQTNCQSQIGNRSFPASTKVWLIHGENDEVFPVEDVRRLAQQFKSWDWPVQLSTFPGRGHGFNADQPLLVRCGAEWCAEQLGSSPSVPVNVRSVRLRYWLPLGVALLLLGCWWFRQGLRVRSEFPFLVGDDVRSRSGEHPSCQPPASVQTADPARKACAVRWLQWGAGIITVLALLDSALHLGLPSLPVTPHTVRWAERFIVRPELKESFRWLVNHPVAADVSSLTSLEALDANQSGFNVLPTSPPEEHSHTLHTLLDHVELAVLQRQLADWTVSETLWRNYVLSPWITANEPDPRWRRMLWEHLYPKVRRESDPAAVAEIVARELALRVVVRQGSPPDQSIREMWTEGVTDQKGFERLYMAGLRSVGVPARITGDGRGEFHNGAKWRSAPRPFNEPLVASQSGGKPGP